MNYAHYMYRIVRMLNLTGMPRTNHAQTHQNTNSNNITKQEIHVYILYNSYLICFYDCIYLNFKFEHINHAV